MHPETDDNLDKPETPEDDVFVLGRDGNIYHCDDANEADAVTEERP